MLRRSPIVHWVLVTLLVGGCATRPMPPVELEFRVPPEDIALEARELASRDDVEFIVAELSDGSHVRVVAAVDSTGQGVFRIAEPPGTVVDLATIRSLEVRADSGLAFKVVMAVLAPLFAAMFVGMILSGGE